MKPFWYWVICLLAMLGMGYSVLDRLKLKTNSRAERAALALAVGHGILAYIVFVMGSLGYLQQPVMLALIVVLAAIFLYALIPAWQGMLDAIVTEFRSYSIWEKIFLAAGLTAGFFSLAAALAPAIGQDELCYHLMQPKNYVRAGRIYEVPYSLNSLWPYLMEMLFTLGVAVSGSEMAKLFHFSMTITAVLAAYGFSKRFFGSKTALTASLVYALTPAVFMQAGFAYVDNALAAYVFLAIYAWFVFREEKGMGWAVLAGVFAGLALSTKLTGLIVLPVLAAAAFYDLLKSPSKASVLKGCAWAVLMTVLCGATWYIRAWILRGNPVFPFFPQFFGGHGWQDPTYVGSHGRPHALGFLLLPWDLTLHPEWFGGEHIGVLYLMLAPLLLAFNPKKPTGVLLSCLAVYTVSWFKLDPNVRFFFPGLLLLSPLCAHALIEIKEGVGGAWKTLVLGLTMAAFIGQAAFAPYRFRDEADLFFHRQPGHYLKIHERSYFAAQQINRALLPGDKILSVNEVRGYYFDNPFVLEGDFTRFTGYDAKFKNAGEVRDYLKSIGFTHVLMTDLPEGRGETLSPMRVASLISSGAGHDFFKEELIAKNGKVRYSLYRIL